MVHGVNIVAFIVYGIADFFFRPQIKRLNEKESNILPTLIYGTTFLETVD